MTTGLTNRATHAGRWGAAARRAFWKSRHRDNINQLKEKVMKYTRALAFALLAGATIVTSGCAVIRGQESVGAYVDDTAITTAVKAKFVEDKSVDAGAIKVETLNGTVALSGFAKSNAEKAQAEFIARNTKGVREVRNNLTVRP
jgi:osmotically-inducible protein OsmY